MPLGYSPSLPRPPFPQQKKKNNGANQSRRAGFSSFPSTNFDKCLLNSALGSGRNIISMRITKADLLSPGERVLWGLNRTFLSPSNRHRVVLAFFFEEGFIKLCTRILFLWPASDFHKIITCMRAMTISKDYWEKSRHISPTFLFFMKPSLFVPLVVSSWVFRMLTNCRPLRRGKRGGGVVW